MGQQLMIDDIFKAIGQMSDPKFMGVFFRGVGLTVLLLVLTTLFVLWLLPNSVSLPYFGELEWLSSVLDGFAIFGMFALSIFLMVPVASLFIGLFLDRIMDAVEARHYPNAGPVRKVGMGETIMDSLGFLGLMIVVNLFALILYLFIPVAFWVVNGILLGREYFQMVAVRRVGRKEGKALRKANRPQIWIAGTLMAVPLTVPVLNLIIPILGAAMFTHLFHRISGK